MICAPSAAIRFPCSTAFSVVKNSPPSEKESGRDIEHAHDHCALREIDRPAGNFPERPTHPGETITERACYSTAHLGYTFAKPDLRGCNARKRMPDRPRRLVMRATSRGD